MIWSLLFRVYVEYRVYGLVFQVWGYGFRLKACLLGGYLEISYKLLSVLLDISSTL